MGHSAAVDRVREYYRENQILYTLFWTERRALSMNIGLWTPGTRSRIEALENQNALLGELLQPSPADHLLEAGCGTGGSSIWLSQRFGAKVCGITLCERQASIAARYARMRGVADKVRFSATDFTQAAFRDAPFTGIFASESVCHAERKELFVAEAFRLLQPGGRLVVIDAFLTDAPFGAQERRLLDDWFQGWAVPGLASQDEFRTMLLAVGFERLTFRDLTPYIMPSARRVFVWGVVAAPVIRALRCVGIATRSQAGHATACRRVIGLVKRNVCVFGVFSARKPAVDDNVRGAAG